MAFLADSENVVESRETAPDKLRADLGFYPFGHHESGLIVKRLGSFGQQVNITTPNIDESLYLPVIKQRVVFHGKENAFRDQDQWSDFVRSTVDTSTTFEDHFIFLSSINNLSSSLLKNYHHRSYEDASKSVPTAQLYNYNLVSYEFKEQVDKVQEIADIRTTFDRGFTPITAGSTTVQQQNRFMIENSNTLSSSLNRFTNRLDNYVSSSAIIYTKQSNVFTLNDDTTGRLVQKEDFPFCLYKSGLDPVTNSQFNNILDRNDKTKNIFQYIKRNLGFGIKSFSNSEDEIDVRLHNAVDFFSRTTVRSFIEAQDEIFLLDSESLNHSNPSERFVEQIKTIKFVQETRQMLFDKLRDLEDIFSRRSCETFTMGYKIEKYIDSDVGTPIQTYYSTRHDFVDTQLKYGRTYVYKISRLVGIIGSSYKYSNLFYSINEFDYSNENNEQPSIIPAETADISEHKYRAFVDVTVSPSFMIAEIPIEDRNSSICFMDSPTLPPQIHMYCEKNKPLVQTILKPNFYRLVNYNNQDVIRNVGVLTEADQQLSDNYLLSIDNSVDYRYFNGTYEVYRMDKPPETIKDFANYFLKTVEMDEVYINQRREPQDQLEPPNSNIQPPSEQITTRNLTAYCKDQILPNRKYYYAFRTLTYHGTPSELTGVYEVELLKDSDEYKINVKEYKIPEPKNYKFTKSAKRIIKIEPNLDQIFFTKADSVSSYELGDNNLFRKQNPKTFKIRVRSKHTGRMVDLNVTFRIKLPTPP